MDENNNNNQIPQNEEMEEMTVPTVKNLDPKLFVAVVLIILVIVGIVITMLGKTQNVEQSPEVLPPVTPDATAPAIDYGPEKVSAGEALPEGFPKELILGENTKVTEGYSLDYGDLIQRTAIYNMDSTTEDIYEQYIQLLKKAGWVLMNTYKSKKISSFYAMKKNEELSITIDEREDGESLASQISISLIYK
jgi:hypothetical protein